MPKGFVFEDRASLGEIAFAEAPLTPTPQLSPEIPFVEGYDIDSSPPLERLTSDDHLVTKWHFQEFRRRFVPDLIRATSVSTAFYRLVDSSRVVETPSRYRSEIVGDRVPFPGIQIRRIREVKQMPKETDNANTFDKHRGLQLSSYAIVKGSLIAARPAIEAEEGVKPQSLQDFTLELIDHLKNI